MTQLYNEYHANRVAIALQISDTGSHNPDNVMCPGDWEFIAVCAEHSRETCPEALSLDDNCLRWKVRVLDGIGESIGYW